MWVPICLSSRLKTICIRGFKGRPDEMEEAKYLLKHGEVLNNLINYTHDFPVEHMMELRQEISMSLGLRGLVKLNFQNSGI